VDEAVLRAVAALRPGDDAALLAALGRDVPAERLRAWLEDVHVRDPGPVLDATADPAGLAAAMRDARTASGLWRVLRRRSPAAVALAGALGAEAQARRWLDELRHVRLEIGGDDLLAAGVAAGPEMGRRLDAALARKLDGEVRGREEELAAALEARV
jgi:tRNA nucleotidyltransferase (CCA-adding enzyme)